MAVPAGRKAKLPVPRWDGDLRQLWYAGQLLFTLDKAAPLEELILEAFQEQHWPRRIDDPLPGETDIDPKPRLHNAVVRINRHLQGKPIRLRRDGSGCGILWDRI